MPCPCSARSAGSGAELHQVHALADVSANGMRQSASAMVNYRYDLQKVETNHEAYATQNVVAMSKDIRALFSNGRPRGRSRE